MVSNPVSSSPPCKTPVASNETRGRPVVRRSAGAIRREGRPADVALPELTDEWFDALIRQVDRASADLRSAWRER